MSFEPANLRHLLAEMLGEDNALTSELRALFLASATGHVAALSTAADRDAWRNEALKLQGLAASFGVTPLLALATEATNRSPDGDLLDRIACALADCR